MQISYQVLLAVISAVLAAPLEKRETTEQDLGLNAADYFTKYGYPGPVSQDQLIHRDAYITAFNRQTRNPYWSVEHISAASIKPQAGVNRDGSKFQEDENIPEIFRSTLKDYYKSGFDRGHQAPAGDVQFAQDALDQTFYLSNMAPQVGVGFNRNYWAWTEEFGRSLTKSYDTVRILTGPLYLPTLGSDGKYTVSYQVIGNPANVAVPTHFFKMTIGENKGSSEADVAAFVLPNKYIPDSTDLKSFQVDLPTLAKQSGLDIFTNVQSGIQVNDLCTKLTCQTIKYSHDRYGQNA